MQRTKACNIRKATYDDILDIAYLGKKFAKESQNSGLGWSQEKVFNSLHDAVQRDDFLILVMEKDDEVIGFFAGLVTPCFFSDAKQAVDLAWFVHKDHRGSREALGMIDMYEEWAKKSGAVFVNMVNLDVLNGDKVRKMYEKRGYRLVENTFAKELN